MSYTKKHRILKRIAEHEEKNDESKKIKNKNEEIVIVSNVKKTKKITQVELQNCANNEFNEHVNVTMPKDAINDSCGNKNKNSNEFTIEIASTTKNVLTINEKLMALASKHANNLQHNLLTDILILLRSEGYVSLPKTAQTFLGTPQIQNIELMKTKGDSWGKYAYLGIEHQLQKRIFSQVFNIEKIEIFINIDGVQVYRSSNKQFWPILMKIPSS